MQPDPPHDDVTRPPPARRPQGAAQLLASALRLAEIQWQILLTHAKLTALHVALFAALLIASLLFAILAVIFLYIGTFKLLTDVAQMPPVWAYLLFGGTHLLLALSLAFLAVRKLSRTSSLPSAPPPAQPTTTPAEEPTS